MGSGSVIFYSLAVNDWFFPASFHNIPFYITLKKFKENNLNRRTENFNTFKYHVSCTDGKISVKINLLFYLYLSPLSHVSSLATGHTWRPVENVVITTKGLQDRKMHILDGATVENIGKTEKFTFNDHKSWLSEKGKQSKVEFIGSWLI